MLFLETTKKKKSEPELANKYFQRPALFLPSHIAKGLIELGLS